MEKKGEEAKSEKAPEKIESKDPIEKPIDAQSDPNPDK